MKSNRAIIFAVSISMVFSFLYGVLTVRYKLFPFEQLKSVWQLVEADNAQLRKRVRKSNMKGKNYYKDKVSFFETLGGRDYDVVFVGDSLTDNAEWQDSFPSLRIANRGISGDKTDGIGRRIESIYSTSASTAFIMMGLNDFLAGVEINKVFQNYKDVVNKLTHRKMTVYIQSTILTGSQKSSNAGLNNKILALNERLRNFAKKTDSVFYVDLNAVLAPNLLLGEEFTRDGLHLNGDGYAKWNNLIQPYLVQYASINDRK